MAFKLSNADNRSAAQKGAIVGSSLLAVGGLVMTKGATRPLLVGLGLVGVVVSIVFLARQCKTGERLRTARGLAQPRCVPA